MWGDHYHGAKSHMPRELAYYLSADSAPPGYAVQRPWWLGFVFLAVLSVAVVAATDALSVLTSGYADLVSGLSGSPRARLLAGGTETLALRPFVIVLFGALALFAPGTARDRLQLLVRSWVTLLVVALITDSFLADSVGFGFPNPFTHRGGVISVVIALAVFIWQLFTQYALPRDVRVHAETTRKLRPLLIGAGAVTVSAALVYLTRDARHAVFRDVRHPADQRLCFNRRLLPGHHRDSPLPRGELPTPETARA